MMRRAGDSRLTGQSAWSGLVVLCALFAAPSMVVAEGPTYLLKAGRIYTMADGDGWVIDRGMILVKDGKIEAVGTTIDAPPFIETIDLPDAVILPGLVSADSWIAGQHQGPDSVGAQYRAIDAFNPYLEADRLLAGGVTTVYLNPGRHRLVSGVGAVVRIGVTGSSAVLEDEADLSINLGEPAFNPPAREHWLVPPSSDLKIIPDERQRPSSRLTQILQLNESFDFALAYAAKRGAGGKLAEKPAFDASLEALSEQVRRKAVLRIRADRAVDIEQAIKFAAARKHSVVITGAREAEKAASILLDAKAPIVFEAPVNPNIPGMDLGADPDVLEDQFVIPESLASLPLAVTGPAGAPHGELLTYAALARRAGLSRRTALEAITSDAAKILGVGARVGSIAPGREADFLVLGGEPLEAGTHVLRTYVGGRLKFDARRVADDRLVIRAGRIWTGDRWIENGSVLVEKGRVTAVGETTSVPPYTRIVDAGRDAVVTPGFIDARGHLGCEGDHSSAAGDASLADALYQALPEFARVCRAGVTTVLSSAYRPGGNGARISAIHTAGDHRGELIVKETAGLLLSIRGQDTESAAGRIRGALSAGLKYDEAWKKYEKELAEYKAKGAPKPEEKKEPEKKPEEGATEKPPEDPVTGTWEGELSGGPLPEPQQFTAKMKLTGEEVVGSIEVALGDGEEIGFKGTYRDKHLTLQIEAEQIPNIKIVIEADIDRDDHLIGFIDVGGRARFDIEANRTEKTVPEIKIKRSRKKKDGGPEAPRKDEALEPYRELFAGKIAMVIDVDSRQAIEAILPIFEKEHKVPFVLLNADEAMKLAPAIAKAGTGVILKTTPVETVNRREVVQSVDLSRAGISVAFQSDAEDAARLLPLRATFAIRRGMDPTAALKALTGDAATMMKCDEVVGFLKPGCRGDLLIFDGQPLAPETRLTRVFVDGKEVQR